MQNQLLISNVSNDMELMRYKDDNNQGAWFNSSKSLKLIGTNSPYSKNSSFFYDIDDISKTL